MWNSFQGWPDRHTARRAPLCTCPTSCRRWTSRRSTTARRWRARSVGTGQTGRQNSRNAAALGCWEGIQINVIVLLTTTFLKLKLEAILFFWLTSMHLAVWHKTSTARVIQKALCSWLWRSVQRLHASTFPPLHFEDTAVSITINSLDIGGYWIQCDYDLNCVHALNKYQCNDSLTIC